MISIWFVLALFFLFCFYVCMEKHLKSSQEKGKKEQRNLQEKDKKELLKEIRKSNDIRNEVSKIYRETLEKIVAGKIPTPPDFLHNQEELLEAFRKDTEKWAESIGELKGIEKDRFELEYLVLEARAAQIDPKLRPFIQPVASSFKEVVSALNKADVYGGEIKIEVFELKDPIMYASTKFKPHGRSAQKFIYIIFPNGRHWPINLTSSVITPDTPEDFQGGVSIMSRIGKLNFSIDVLMNGKYHFSTGRPSEGWPISLAGKTGDVDFLRDVVKCIFQRDLTLNCSKK